MRSETLRNQFNKALGFTFAELLASMLFVAVVVPVAVQGLTIANRAGVVADRKRIAGELADNLLNEWIVTEEWRNGLRAGDFGEGWPGYHWVLEESDWDEDDTLSVITVHVFFVVQEKEYSISLSTLAEEADESEETEQATQ